LDKGSTYRIVYKDQDYTKLISGRLLSEDSNLLEIDDIKLGRIWIGKSAIISIKAIGEDNGYKSRSS